MTASSKPATTKTVDIRREAMRVGGERMMRDHVIEVRNPYTGALVGTVPKGTPADVERAIAIGKSYKPKLTRHERYAICYRVADLIRQRANAISDVITAEC